MDKNQLQSKFRIVYIISTALLFLTILLPAYICFDNYYKTISAKKVIMMWTAIFGTASNRTLNIAFDFSWVGFIPFVLAFIILVIALVRKFITIDGSSKSLETIDLSLDILNLALALIITILFAFTPMAISNSNAKAGLYVSRYGFGVSFIVCYVICAVMIVSSLCVLYANTIIKVKKLKDKKKNQSKKDSE